MKDAGLTAADIDAVIFGAITRDYSEPATVDRVMDILGIKNAYAFDIFNACNAFISSIDVADSLIKTGKAEHILVVCGEALSKWTKFDYTDKEELLARAPVALSVGDGGGAFVISKSGDGAQSQILHSKFRTYPELWDVGVIWGGGVVYPKDSDKLFVPGTVKKLTQRHSDVSQIFIPEALKETGWDVNEVDCFLPTQIANWIVQNIQKLIGANDDQFYKIINTTGNVGACNIALTTYMAREAGKISTGSKVVMMGGAAGANVGVINAIL